MSSANAIVLGIEGLPVKSKVEQRFRTIALSSPRWLQKVERNVSEQYCSEKSFRVCAHRAMVSAKNRLTFLPSPTLRLISLKREQLSVFA